MIEKKIIESPQIIPTVTKLLLSKIANVSGLNPIIKINEK